MGALVLTFSTIAGEGPGRAARPALSEATKPLAAMYQVGLVDLDGVVCWGERPVPHATAALNLAGSSGMHPLFVTNNASRTPGEVVSLLQGLGFTATERDVITAAQAAAWLVASLVPPRSRILVIGGSAMEHAICEENLTPVRSANDTPQAIVQGLSPDVDWGQLAECAYAVARGLPWVVSNMDSAVPRDRGIAPGNGAMAAVIRIVTGREPLVAGKPERGLYQEALRRRGDGQVLSIGDRLDTDIAGASRLDMDSMLVLTGVTSVTDLLAAPPPHRPTYVAADLQGLLEVHPAVRSTRDGWHCGRWTANVVAGEIILRPAPTGALDMNAVRAMCRAAWAAQDAGHAVSLADGIRHALPKLRPT